MSRSTVVKIAAIAAMAAGMIAVGSSMAQAGGPANPSTPAVVTSATPTPTPTIDPNNPWD
jgi:hypothetical protein